MLDREINSLLEPLLKKRLERFGFMRSEVRAGRDHDGDSALFVIAHYGPISKVPDEDTLLETVADVRQLLSKHGDERFPYVRHRFEPADLEPAER